MTTVSWFFDLESRTFDLGPLAIPAVAQATDPELRAARRRVKDYLRYLEEEGFTRMNRKQMLYSSRELSSGRTGRPKPTQRLYPIVQGP